MRTIALFFCILFIPCVSLYSEIINGYSAKLAATRLEIHNLDSLIRDSDLSGKELKKIKNCIKRLRNLQETEKELTVWHEKTEALLRQLRDIDPVLYHEIDAITDSEGHPTDVYVKVVMNGELIHGAVATTNLNQCPDNPNAYTSEFGRHTVCVQVCALKNILVSLVHEFGHVRYLVPNLKSYMEYYNKYYNNHSDKFTAMHQYNVGHNSDDPSHQSVKFVLSRFHVRQDSLEILPTMDTGDKEPDL